MTSIIQSDRLDLVPMQPAVLRALLAGDCREAEKLLGITAPTDWDISRSALELRLSQLEANPELQPWLLRAISLREQRLLVDHIGFHTAPGAEYLAELSPDGVEFGVGVHRFARFRGDALPTPRFQLGFRKIGSHVDELDGPEDIFERTSAAYTG